MPNLLAGRYPGWRKNPLKNRAFPATRRIFRKMQRHFQWQCAVLGGACARCTRRAPLTVAGAAQVGRLARGAPRPPASRLTAPARAAGASTNIADCMDAILRRTDAGITGRCTATYALKSVGKEQQCHLPADCHTPPSAARPCKGALACMIAAIPCSLAWPHVPAGRHASQFQYFTHLQQEKPAKCGTTPPPKEPLQNLPQA